MERNRLRNMRHILVSCLLVLTILLFVKIPSYAINPTNAVEVQVNSANESGSIKKGAEVWYKFEVPDGDSWLVVRLTTTSERANIDCEVKGIHMDTIRGAYSLGGNHMAELVFRINDMDSGTTDEFISRVNSGSTYFVRVSGEGDFNFNVDSYVDDYKGEFSNATALTAGNTITGSLERNDDIDSFCFTVPDNYAYKITVKASKKMDVKIADKNNYILDNNSLRVMRDRGTSEYVVSGNGTKRYFFLSGQASTSYTISVKQSKNDASLGDWTKVTATKGKSYITIKTREGAKISITLKGSKKALKINGKKLYRTTQKKAKKKYRLNRKLKKGDVITVTATKGRRYAFSYTKKIK